MTYTDKPPVTELYRDHECGDHHETCWPSTDTTTSRAEGELAERCRKALGVSDPEAVVLIREIAYAGGWSEFTVEDTFWVEIECDGQKWQSEDSWSNNGLQQLLDWLDEKEMGK